MKIHLEVIGAEPMRVQTAGPGLVYRKHRAEVSREFCGPHVPILADAKQQKWVIHTTSFLTSQEGLCERQDGPRVASRAIVHVLRPDAARERNTCTTAGIGLGGDGLGWVGWARFGWGGAGSDWSEDQATAAAVTSASTPATQSTAASAAEIGPPASCRPYSPTLEAPRAASASSISSLPREYVFS